MADFTVVGGQGYVGRHLVRHLEASGHRVAVPARDMVSVLGQPLGHVVYAVGLTADFRRKPFETVEAHVSLASRILREGIFDSFLYLSSTRVYGHAARGDESAPLVVDPVDPSDLYNLSKLMGESITLQSGRPNTRVVRLSNIVGGHRPSESFLTSLVAEAKSGKVMLRSALASSKDYLHVGDAVAMLAAVALHGRKSLYNIASGTTLSHGVWISALQQRFGCAVAVEADAPVLQFPPIAVRRFQEEFPFRPGSALRALDDFT